MSISPLDFLKNKFVKLNVTPVDLAGKTLVVTGSNVGICYGTILQLVAMHPSRVILACRNMSKAEEAIRKIKTSTNTDGVVIEAQELDLASFASCRALSREWAALAHFDQQRGVMDNNFTLSEDGYEASLATNHLGPVLLTLLLLPVIRMMASLNDSTYPRVITVSSGLHLPTQFPEKDTPNIIKIMNDAKNAESLKNRYAVTKLMNVLFTQSLAHHLQESRHPEDLKITVLETNPGLVSSELGTKADDPLLGRIGYTIAVGLLRSLFARNIIEGAKTSVYAAAVPECGIEKGVHNGQYYSSCSVGKVNPVVEGEAGKELAERLWQETIQTIEVRPHEFNI